MEKIYDFFISHSSKDNDRALELYHVLKEINPAWEVFLDCGPERPLDAVNEWNPSMLASAQNSRYLIFLATSPEQLKEGHGHMYEEISCFHGRSVTRFRHGRPDRTITYFGIIFGSIDYETDLRSDLDRSSEYFSLYNPKQNLHLETGESVRDAFHRIKAKIEHMTSQPNDCSAEILDRVIAYASRRRQQDETFSMDSIDEHLLPPLYAKGNDLKEVSLSFEEFCARLQHSHAVIWGEQGGCGKTTLMTRLFYHYLDQAQTGDPNAMIPLFVDARALIGQNHLITRFLADRLFQEYTARTAAQTSISTGLLTQAFSEQRNSPRYLLLIDGCNELPAASQTAFESKLMEFGEFGHYHNVRVVLAGRNAEQYSTLEGNSFRVSIGKLRHAQVYAYLNQFRQTSESVKDFLLRVQSSEKRGSQIQRQTNDLMEILKTPFFAWIFAQSQEAEQIRTRGALVRQFVSHYSKMILKADASEVICAFHPLCLYHLLPAISFRMLSGNTASSFAFTEDELEAMLPEILEQMHLTPYRKYYGAAYRDQLRAGLPSKDELDVSDQFVKHMIHNDKLLRRTADDAFEFTHQVYRDYFAAYYIKEDLDRSLESGIICQALFADTLSRDTFQFITELMEEEYHPFTWATKETAYSASKLPALLDMARNHPADSARYTANVVELLRRVRKDDLSGLDFSRLDLTKCNLRTCLLARQSTSEVWAANFRGATIHPENLLNMKHSGVIVAACANAQFFVTCDHSGTVMFWERNKQSTMPSKILEMDVSMPRKLLLTPDGQALYMMTNKQLLRVPVPETFQSKVKTEILLNSSQRFGDIRLSEQGVLEFTTAKNPFNFKPVSNPELPNRYPFNIVNSCAAVNDAGTWLAYGFLPYQNGLKLWQMNPETNQWEARKFGYSALLDNYIRDMENLLREFDVYKHFATESELKNLASGDRLKWFDTLQSNGEFENRCRRSSLAKSQQFMLEKLGQKGVTLTDQQISRLDQLRETVGQQVLEGRKNHAALMELSRRNIRSLAWKKNSNTLLIAYTNPYTPVYKRLTDGREMIGTQWKNAVVELDVDTMTIRLIAEFSSTRSAAFSASYEDDRIAIIHQGNAFFCSESGEPDQRIGYKSAWIGGFVAMGEDGDVYAVSPESIYRLDRNHRFNGAWHNDLKETELVLCVRPDGRHCLAKMSSFELARKGKLSSKTPIVDTDSGLIEKIPKNDFLLLQPVDYADRSSETPLRAICVGSRSYHFETTKLRCYDQDVKTREINIYHKLFICGCDFREIRGHMAAPEYLQILEQYGATTDAPLPESVSPAVVDSDCTPWTPSQRPFHYIAADRKIDLKQGNPDTQTDFYWGSIQTALTDSAYAVLEGIMFLGIATPEIISQLSTTPLIRKRYADKTTSILTSLEWWGLIYQPVRTDCGMLVYALTSKGGKALLRRASASYHEKEANEEAWEQARLNYRKRLRSNIWFAATAHRHGRQIRDYGIYTVMDSTVLMSARGRISGYLKLGEQAFFAEPVPELDSEQNVTQLQGKVRRMCAIAGCYGHLSRYEGTCLCPVELSRTPVLVFIGESYAHCRQIDACIRDIQPGIRKIYTFDALLMDQARKHKHFEFVDGKPHEVDLGTLIGEMP